MMQAVQRKIEYNAPVALPRKRIVKMEGNVAYISNDFAEKKVRKPAVVAKPKTVKKTGLASTLFVLLMVFCASALLISRCLAACLVSAKNNELEKEIQTVQTKIGLLQVDIELQENLLQVQQTARQELNMTYPSPDQIINIEPGG